MNNPYKTMKADGKIFRKYALKNKSAAEINQLLTEHYPMLERCARQSAEEYRKIQKQFEDPQILQGLFDRCGELCKDGVLPENNAVIDFFDGEINGLLLPYLPVAITCALVHKCAEAVMHDDSALLEKSIRSLQRMRDVDFGGISEKLFSAEEILMSDPAGVYPYMNREIKETYRRKIAFLASENRKTEKEIATDILEKSKNNGDHIGKLLFAEKKNTKRSEIYLIMEIIIPLLICVSSAILSGEWLISFLLYLPAWEIMRHPIETASLRNAAPKKLASLELNSKTVSEARALITLSVILPSPDKINELKNKLEDLYLSNAYGNIKVCCLADFKASDAPRKSEDRHILNALNKAVNELNKKYSGGFIAAVRPRSYSETQNEFIGKERKRGAIRDLIRAIKGNQKDFSSITGDTENLSEVKYLFALDYDSTPVFDSLRELVAAAEHPLNKPVIKNGRVVSGYGIFAPKTQNSLPSASKSFFSSVMSQDSGVSAYDEHSAERYQTLFGESIFCGKGLINVDVYHELLDRGLPKERILSHDIIEGEFLRTGFIPKAQITEDFPSTADVYCKRLHRWVRGDWQNSGFVFGKNPLSFVSRFKLFDNIRRSITPVICLAVIVYSAFYQGYAGVIGAVISAFALCASDIFSGINSVIQSDFYSVTHLFYSKRIPEGLGCFVRAFLSVAYSAREAFVCIDAIIRALWRMYISGDRLLEWNTSASSEQNGKNFSVYTCIPAVLTAAVLIVFGLPIHRMIGLIILGDIPLTLFGNLPLKQKNKGITLEQKEYLLSVASSMWEYFEDLCGEENNSLPPDNIQFAPHRAIAKRTSPTNIGLMLACFLAARDFDFITTQEMNCRINRSLSSIEKLEKYKGNLLNWYSTSTLETLPLRFVSSVDSGNFLCCLTAVKEGIKEYINECSELEKTVEKLEKIIETTDLSVMFNSRRKLFSTGINPDNNEKTESCYDLYMSEMRMTSYFAVARKLVPKDHWNALDRPVVRNGRYSGLASWTGTMFEYFMADIFVPAPYGSMSDEALRFCLQSQIKKAGKNPFGMSESAFYAFDGELNYQYKAHGVQKLAFRRDSDKYNVISPYSSFLTLNIAPRLSLKNLRRLEKLGIKGKYGFYEAVDLTSKNQFHAVNSFMVHHIGMSLLSVDNLLNGKCMQKRFMRDRYMRGAKTLLGEKPIAGEEVFRDIVEDNVIPASREKVYVRNGVWRKVSEAPDFSVFSNGRMSLLLNNCGIMSVMFDGEKAWSTKHSAVFEFDNEQYNFLNKNSEIRISDIIAEYRTSYKETDLHSQIFMPENRNCVVVKYTIENKNKNKAAVGKIRVKEIENKTACFVECGFTDREMKRCDGFLESEIEIPAGKTKEAIFVYATETSGDEATVLFESMKTESIVRKKAKNPFSADSFIKALSEKYLTNLIDYETKEDIKLSEDTVITGEYPVMMVRINNMKSSESLRFFVVFNKILRNCGIKNTLVICYNVSKDKKTSALQTIETVLNEERCNLMLGIGGGIYVFNEINLQKSVFEKLRKRSQMFEEL